MNDLKQRIAEFVAKRERAAAGIFKATRHALYGADCLIYMIPHDAMTSPETHRRQHSDAIFFEASANDAVPLLQDLMREIERLEGENAAIKAGQAQVELLRTLDRKHIEDLQKRIIELDRPTSQP